MSMNIKSQEAHDLARELAALTGESVTQAVTTALRERLDRLHAESSTEARVERLRALTHEIHDLLSPETLALDVDELLYDERGLPR